MSDGGSGRRRSVDVGGLALALSESEGGGLGHGWGGWEETENGETKYVIHIHSLSIPHTGPSSDQDLTSLRYAEVLIDVRAHTETMLNCEHQDE